MKTYTSRFIRIGDLVVAAFDEAARYSDDPKEVSRMAARMVTHLLQAARKSLGSAAVAGCIEQDKLS